MLIVDDDADSAEVAGFHLERRGHEVRLAYEGEGALLVLATFLPDVAVLDGRLGRESGCAVAKQLLRMPGLAGCRLVPCRGCQRRQVNEEAAVTGILFFRQLSKPFSGEALVESVEAKAAADTQESAAG